MEKSLTEIEEERERFVQECLHYQGHFAHPLDVERTKYFWKGFFWASMNWVVIFAAGLILWGLN